MSAIAQSIDINAPIDVVFNAISDFESYPYFLEGMKKVEVLKKKGKHRTVKFTLDLFKRVVYTLDMKLNKPDEILWTLVDADLMKKNEGRWLLTDLDGDATNAEYDIDIELKIWVPGPISDFLVHSSIPKTLESFKKKIEETYGHQ